MLGFRVWNNEVPPELGIAVPNAELTGRRRVDALPARSRIDRERLAGKAASRWRSG
jgi:hypothetical protein